MGRFLLNRLWAFFLLSLVINFSAFRDGKVLTDNMGAHPLDEERWVQQGEPPIDPTPGLGTKEVPRSDGGKDTTYYSITTPEEEEKARQEEKDKSDKSLDVLKNIIIDRRNH